MYINYNPNPQGIKTGDCVVRALTLALNKSWHEAYIQLVIKGLEMADMPSSNAVCSNPQKAIIVFKRCRNTPLFSLLKSN